MSLSQFLQSHDLIHLSDKLLRAGYPDLPSLRHLLLNEESLDALDLVSREAKKLASAIKQIPYDSKLPTVLALPLGEFEREQNPVLALWAMCDFAELTLKLLVMAAAAEHEVLPEAMSAVFHKRIERPTLGGWHDMARVAVENLAVGSVLPMLPPAFKALSKLVGFESQGPDRSLLCVRNRLAHGRPTRAEAAEWLKAWRRPISDFVDKSIGWLAKTRFVAVDKNGGRYLLQGEIGIEFQGSIPIPQDAAVGSAWLLVGDNALDLGLLAAFDFENRAPLVFMRSQDVSLQYLRIAATGGAWESNIQEWTAFQSRFLGPPNRAASRTVRLFDEEIHREAQRRVGRETELQHLWEAVVQLERGCVWIGGTAGIGKSNLMASLMQRLRESPPENVLVLPYRFRSQDDRNSRGAFLSYFCEQLEVSGFLKAAETDSPHFSGHGNPVKLVMERLERLSPPQRVLLVVDGLDEIMPHDERFVEDALLCFVQRGVIVVGAGRPELDIQESFRRKKAVEPFPDGLGAMTQEDVRSMLFDRLFGEARRGVLLSDREEGSKVENTFIEQVANRSEGLPIYVNYVIGDISARRIRPDNPNDLPRGIHAYHTELLRRCSAGDLQAVVTPMLVSVALAYEPLSEEEITALLKRFGRLETMNLSLVGRGLTLLGSMLRRSTKANGKGGITVYHDSLRSHILQDLALAETVASTKKGFANESTKPEGDPAEDYLYRNGVAHLLEANRFNDAVHIQTDFEFLMARFRALDESGRAAADWYADWEHLRKACDFEGDTRVWWDFARTHRHYFFAKDWETWRVLFQAAMDHADDSPVTMAAEGFLAAGKVDWIWLRCVNRRKQWVPNSLEVVLVGNEGPVQWARELKSGKILSRSVDKGLRIWDQHTGECLSVLSADAGFELNDDRILYWSYDHNSLRISDLQTGGCEVGLVGHEGPIHGAIELRDSSILSWSADETLRVWNQRTGECTCVAGHKGPVYKVIELKDGRIMPLSHDNKLRIWNLYIQHCDHVSTSDDRVINGAIQLSNGRILFWSGKNLWIWDLQTNKCFINFCNHEENVRGAIELRDGRILSWSSNGHGLSPETIGSLQVWSPKSFGADLLLSDEHQISVLKAIELNDGRVLSLSREGTQIWDQNTGNCVATLSNRPDGWVDGVIELRDGRIVSWSHDNTLQVWDQRTSKLESPLQGHDSFVIGAIELRGGRVLSWSHDQTLRIWNLRAKECFDFPSCNNRKARGAILLRNGGIVSWSDDYTLRILCKDTGQCRGVFSGHLAPVAGAVQLEDNRLLSWGQDYILRIWDLNTRVSLFTLSGHTGELSDVCKLKDGRVLTASEDKTLRVWNTITGVCEFVLAGHEQNDAPLETMNGFNLGSGLGTYFRTMVLTDGRALSWADDATICLWNLISGKCEFAFRGHKKKDKSFLQITELNDGRILSWPLQSDENKLRIWNLRNGKSDAVLAGHGAPINGATVLTDGRILSWSTDKTLRIWDPCTGVCANVLSGHEATVLAAFELKNGKVLSWADDKTLRVWDQYTGLCLGVLSDHGGATLRPRELNDGCILSCSYDRSILRIWDPRTGVCKSAFEGDAGGSDAALELEDGRILSYSRDAVWIWDKQRAGCHALLYPKNWSARDIDLLRKYKALRDVFIVQHDMTSLFSPRTRGRAYTIGDWQAVIDGRLVSVFAGRNCEEQHRPLSEVP